MLSKKLKNVFFLLITLLPALVNAVGISRDNAIHSMEPWIQVPDGTLVSPFLNPNDSTNQDALDCSAGFSLAGGKILSQSSIHIMPLVTQAIFVIEGCLEVLMRKPGSSLKSHHLTADQAILIPPNTFLQIINEAGSPAKVLYVVNPAYVFLLDDDNVPEYDDSFIVKETWEELARKNWIPEGMPALDLLQDRRDEAERKIKEKKSALSLSCR